MTPSTAATAPRTRRPSTRAVLLAGLALSLLLAVVVSVYASSHPDGLEHVAEQVGFSGTAEDSASAGSPLADYETEGVSDERLSVGLAGLLGVVLTGLVMWGLLQLLRPRRSADDPGSSTSTPTTEPARPAGP